MSTQPDDGPGDDWWTPVRPDRISPADWERMSGYARMRACRRSIHAVPDLEPEPKEPGWTRNQMMAGRLAYERWAKGGRVGELPEADRAAWRAYQRSRDLKRRVNGPPGRRQVSRSVRLVNAQEMAAQGETVVGAAARMGILPKSLLRMLARVPGGDVVRRQLRANEGMPLVPMVVSLTPAEAAAVVARVQRGAAS